MNTNKTVDTLNSFLRGEISAVETYDQALTSLKELSARSDFEANRQSHQARVASLRARIAELGGKPAEGSGAWGSFVKLVEGGAAVMGEKAAVAAIEEGEDHGLADFRRDMAALDPTVRSWFEREIMPAQLQSHERMSRLKKLMN